MLITQINNYSYTSAAKKVSFKSNAEHEAMLRALRAAQAEEMKRKYARINELFNYEIKDSGCHNMAQFTLNFVCAIENNSEHKLDEFFASELKAAELRKNLSPECQRNSLEIREEIQSQPVFKDPALALVSAKEMKEFVPDEEFLRDTRFKSTIDAAKKTYANVVRNADKTKFNKYETGLMEELTQIIENAPNLDFGEEYDKKLKMLLDSIKNRKQEAEKVLVKQKVSIPQIIKKFI